MLNTLTTEFLLIFKHWRYVCYRAYIMRKLAVRNSALGFLFEPFILIISTYCIAIVWSKLFGKGGGLEFIEFFLYVLVSFFVWNFISSIVTGLSGSLLGRIKLITNTQDPILSGVLMDLVANTINFLISLPIVLGMLLVFSDLPMAGLLFLFYGLFLILITGIGCGLTIGIACLFIGDLRAIINAVMRVAFLLTPVIWQVERLGEYQKFIYWNPFYNYLAICRDGLLTGTVGSKEIYIASSTTIVLVLIGILVLSKFKNRLRERAFAL